MIINDIPFNADLSDIITELQTQLSLNGIKLLQITRDSPGDIMCACPYHKNGQERKPSAGIKKSDGTFHCFACGETHSLQEVISFCFGHTDDMVGAFGWNWLLKNFLTVDVEERKDIVLDFERGTTRSNSSGNQFVSEEELDKYRVYHPYMWRRKMTPEVVDIFDIGYDKSTRCLTFPNRDVNGNTLFVARRSVVTKFFNYPRDVDKPVYGLYELHQAFIDGESQYNWLPYQLEDIVICESMIDAITCWVYGKYAVALNGLGTDSQFETLRKLPNRHFILGTDSDNAGMQARERIRKNIPNKLLSEFMFPRGIKDINELSQDQFNNLVETY